MFRTCPVHEGQELEAKISELSQYKQEGIVRVDGFVVFVSGAAVAVGQQVKIRVTKIMSRAAEAELIG